ncbi:unnamed protein product [Plutella xylostella]|uniref:RAB6-interacting golgin n=1 Tax=Plutella xylostella TaxID=51655 RepID=A0A8S4D0F3_PLUXY|nr:unnamed protein product [Plutella xylostella]
MSFLGFTEEDLMRIKSADTRTNNEEGLKVDTENIKRIDKIGAKPRKLPQYKLKTQTSDDAIDSLNFDKCRLSIKSPSSPLSPDTDVANNNNVNATTVESEKQEAATIDLSKESSEGESNSIASSRKSSAGVAPDIVRGVTNYTENEAATHKVKLVELQLKQKLMEEQNKKRKEMLSKALADRTKQTEEQVLKLEKIKKELQILDGQFSQDVAMLRKKIDHACLSFADAEKHYLKVEKEFLQAKINLQKEKENKELLTEHLCALITHNETRKAKKLETLMLQLVEDKTDEVNMAVDDDDDEPVIVDGIDERTGKMVEVNMNC